MNIRKGYIDTPTGQVHYLRCGTGQPFVLLHATSDSSTMWEPVLPGLADREYSAIALDIPGHGNSTPPRTKPDAAGYAGLVDEAVRLMGITKYHVLGHHFGATVAAHVAANHGQHIGKLILYGYPLIDEHRREEMKNAAPRVFDREGNEVKRHWVRRWDMSGFGLSEGEESKFTSEMGLRTMIALLQVGPDWYWAYHAIANTDHEALAARINVPTLIIGAPRDHFWTKYDTDEESRIAPALFPDAKYAIFEKAGVDGADEYPDEFCRIVDDFLRG